MQASVPMQNIKTFANIIHVLTRTYMLHMYVFRNALSAHPCTRTCICLAIAVTTQCFVWFLTALHTLIALYLVVPEQSSESRGAGDGRLVSAAELHQRQVLLQSSMRE